MYTIHILRSLDSMVEFFVSISTVSDSRAFVSSYSDGYCSMSVRVLRAFSQYLQDLLVSWSMTVGLA